MRSLLANNASRIRELELALERDVEELEARQKALEKVGSLAEKMTTMLTSFDNRLGSLERSILPIHRSTQKITLLYDNLTKALGSIETIISYYDLSAQEEPNILKGPNEVGLEVYLKSVNKLREARTFLSQQRYKSSERAVVQINEVLKKALIQLDASFKKSLAASSSVVDDLLRGKDTSAAAIEALHHLQTISGQFAFTDSDMVSASKLVETYSQVRSAHLSKLLQPLHAASSTLDQKKSSTYTKGSSVYIDYTKELLQSLKTERELVQKLIVKSHAQNGFQQTIATALDAYLEAGEGMINRARRSLQRKEVSDLYILIDILEHITKYTKEYEGLIAYAGPRGGEILELCAHCKGFIMQFFRDLYDDIKNDSSKQSLSTDGTVHELTSTTLNILKRLLEYSEAIDSMFSENPSNGNLSVVSCSAFIEAVLIALVNTLESKSKGYSKKPTLALIFLLNNYHYILKNVRTSILANAVDKDLDEHFEKLVTEKKRAYQDGWKPFLELLMDTTYVDKGAVQKTLTKQQRELIKDKFKTFNNDFDELLKVQKTYTIPDIELRAEIIKDVKTVLIPMYSRFHDKYRTIEFSKNPEKFFKYDKGSLENAVEKFFDSS
ncbi:Cullin repeat-like-containing domain protein [Cladochytrium replicatum]|nr:Cullin repeat-like-containing domain protein [Cladochytrium replicatum]